MTSLSKPSSSSDQSRPEKPGYWQRRWLEKHYWRFTDAELAGEAGLTVGQVRDFLALIRAERTSTQKQRISHRAKLSPPRCWTPGRVREALVTPRTRLLDRVDGLLMAAMFVCSLVVYLITAARTVTGEDAGELIAAAHGLGVPHPPGYPLWTLMAHVFDISVPFGTVAWRVTLASAVPSAVANALLLALGLKTLQHRLAAVVGSGVFAFSLTHWSQATIPEVYGLNTALVAGVVLLLIRLAERPSVGRLAALAVVAGIGCTNHTTSLPVAAFAAGAAVLIWPQALKSPRVVLLALVAAAAPLLLYGYLPWAASHTPYLNWGNPSSWDAVWAHVTRAQYTATHAAETAQPSYADYLSRLGILAGAMGRQFGSPWVLVLPALGAMILLIRQTGTFLFLSVVAYLCTIGITQYTNYSFDREHVYANQIFFIPGWMALAWWFGGGVDVLLSQAQQRWRPRAVAGAALLPAGLLILLPAWTHYPRVDRSETTLIADYGRTMLDMMDEGALYFPASDHSTFAVMYWQGVEGYRTDVVIADKYGYLEQEALAAQLSVEELTNLDRMPARDRRKTAERILIDRWPSPVYFAGRRNLPEHAGLVQEPKGPLFQLMSADEARAWFPSSDPEAVSKSLMGPPAPVKRQPGLAIWDTLEWIDLADPREGLDFTVQIVQGDFLYMKGFAQARAGLLDEALGSWRRIQADLAPLKQVYNNIGSALAENGRSLEALEFYRKAIGEDGQYVMAMKNLAVVHQQRNEPETAIALLRSILAHDPGLTGIRVELARLLSEHEMFVEALLEYEQLVLRDRNDPLPWGEAGEILEGIGDLAKAAESYEQCLRRDPRNEQVAEALQRVRQGNPRLLEGLAALVDPMGAPPQPEGGMAPDLDPLAGLGLPEIEDAPAGVPIPALMADPLVPGLPQLPDPTRGLTPEAPIPPVGGKR